jgi:hypothetical protein
VSVLPFSRFGHKISANFSGCSLKAAIFTPYFQGSTVLQSTFLLSPDSFLAINGPAMRTF